MTVHPLVIDDIVRRALAEDLGHGRDITSDAVIPAGKAARAAMVSRAAGVLAGLDAAVIAFRLTDPALKITTQAADGDRLTPGQEILAVEGSAHAILIAERTALNFISHLSGIATQTKKYAEAVRGTKAAIADTRKTLPGLRALQKHAVKMGGGVNHRFGLDDAVLIKDNHIVLAGGIGKAIESARKHAGHMVKIEVEVDTLAQLEQALSHNIDAVLLDNMNPGTLAQAVNLVAGRVLTEASGGVNLDNVREIAQSGVDMISVGALTHSVTALDIGLDIDG